MRYKKGVDSLTLDRHGEIGVAVDIVTGFPSADYPAGLHNLFANPDEKDLPKIAQIRESVQVLGAKLLPYYVELSPIAGYGSRPHVEFDGPSPVTLEAEEFLTFREATVLTALQRIRSIRAGGNLPKVRDTINGARLMAAVLLQPQPGGSTSGMSSADERFTARYLAQCDYSFAASIRQGAEALLGHTPEDYMGEEPNSFILSLGRPAILDVASGE